MPSNSLPTLLLPLVALLAACAGATSSPGAAHPSGPAMAAAADSVQPVLAISRGELTRLLEREFPPLLRDAGIPGVSAVVFEVRADGTIDPRSVRVASASAEAFGEAARRLVRGVRFLPLPASIRVQGDFEWSLRNPGAVFRRADPR